MEVNRDQQLFGSSKFFKIYIFFCVCVQHKEETHTGLEQHEGEYMMSESSYLDELFL